MGHRLSRIITRTGDDGSTGLADGRRLPKHDPRIEALGEVDELNSFLGLLLAEPLDPGHAALLHGIQNDLFDLGGELALPDCPQLDAGRLTTLETAAARLNASLPPLKEFILPGGTRPAALAHVCRAVCRRAERRLVAAGQAGNLPQRYLNRLSDLLFILARTLNRQAGQEETTWQRLE